MDFDKNTLIGLLLIGLVLLFTSTELYKEIAYNEPPPGQLVPPAERSTPAVEPNVVRSQEPAATPATGAAGGQERLQESIFEDFGLSANRNTEQIFTIESPLYRAEISTKGPSIRSWVLKEFDDPTGNPVQLIHNPEGNLHLALPIDGDTLRLSNFVFEPETQARTIILDGSNPSAALNFTLNLGNGKRVAYAMNFNHDQYSFDLMTRIEGLQDVIDGFSYGLNYSGALRSTERDLSHDMSYALCYAQAQNETEDFDVSDNPRDQKILTDWTINWAAVRTKYFTAAVLTQNRAGTGVKFTGATSKRAGDLLFKEYGLEVRMPYNRRATGDEFKVYLGPLKYSTLTSYNAGLENMMSLGPAYIIRPLSKLVLWCLVKLYQFIPNYGLVIVLFSILVKIVLHPLTKKSYKSMKAMQKLQPQMQEIREKYKSDPQKMNVEMMKMYKEQGANPMGGCLPMLLQMPLLFALFQVFQSTIELRGAYFFGWITDLSQPDTVYQLPFSLPLYGDGVNILPLFMGITMLLQQLQTGASDPRQKTMGYVMTAVFTLLFNTFPSGLTLYYGLFNLFTIIQQKFIPDETPAKDGDKKNGRGGGGAKKKKKFTPSKKMSRVEMMRQVRNRQKN